MCPKEVILIKSYYIFNATEISWAIFCEDASGFCHDVGLNIAHVLAEVRAVFVEIFGCELVDSHRLLSVIANSDGPMTFRKHHLIVLSSQGLFHLQHIYQFAHELCHFMVPNEVCEAYRWFEETLCEAMSWYVLLQISERGKTVPIQELNGLYAAMDNYVANAQCKRIKIESKPFSDFVARNLNYLSKDCYNRAANAAIAYEIFPLFLEHPELWKIVPYLHILTDDMPLPDAIRQLACAADVAEAGGNQLIKRLTE